MAKKGPNQAFKVEAIEEHTRRGTVKYGLQRRIVYTQPIIKRDPEHLEKWFNRPFIVSINNGIYEGYCLKCMYGQADAFNRF
jgi:hypothetical protein